MSEIVRGTPVGSFRDEAVAGIKSLNSNVPYEVEVARQRALDDAMDRDLGWAGTGLKVLGAALSTAIPIGAVAGGSARAIGVAPKLVTAFERAPMLISKLAPMGTRKAVERIAATALPAAAGGAVSGAGDGQTLSERASNALGGAAQSAGLGLAFKRLPELYKVGKKAANAAGDRLDPMVQDALHDYPSAANAYQQTKNYLGDQYSLAVSQGGQYYDDAMSKLRQAEDSIRRNVPYGGPLLEGADKFYDKRSDTVGTLLDDWNARQQAEERRRSLYP